MHRHTYYLTVLLAWLLPMRRYLRRNAVGGCPRGALGMISGVYALTWQLWRHGPAALFTTAIIAYAPVSHWLSNLCTCVVPSRR